MMEEWRDIKGYEGKYQVSNLGRVRSLGRDIVRRTRYGTMAPYHISGRVLKPLHSQGDYCYVHLFDKDGTSTNHKVHRCCPFWSGGSPVLDGYCFVLTLQR